VPLPGPGPGPGRARLHWQLEHHAFKLHLQGFCIWTLAIKFCNRTLITSAGLCSLAAAARPSRLLGRHVDYAAARPVPVTECSCGAWPVLVRCSAGACALRHGRCLCAARQVLGQCSAGPGARPSPSLGRSGMLPGRRLAAAQWRSRLVAAGRGESRRGRAGDAEPSHNHIIIMDSCGSQLDHVIPAAKSIPAI
jgi:hypothetical protein